VDIEKTKQFDPNEPETDANEMDGQFPDGMFRFEKRIDCIPVDRSAANFENTSLR